MITVDTTEGLVEIDFDKLEMYMKRTDLCCPMVQIDRYTWTATCPMSDREYLINRGIAHWFVAYNYGPTIGKEPIVHAG